MTTPLAEISDYIDSQINAAETQILRALAYVGTQCVNEARTGRTYTDQTGNLNSSTGFALVRDGKIVEMSDFKPVKGGNEGSGTGKAYIQELVSNYPTGIVLIVVAGMNYASYVAGKGFNVLDSAELLAEKLVPQLLSQMGFKLS